MWGIMPSAKTEKRSSAPPVNIVAKSRSVPLADLKKPASASLSMPGVGMNTPIRKIASITSVIRIRRFSSGILLIFGVRAANSDSLRHSASRLYLVDGGLAEAVGLYRDGNRYLAFAEDLHEHLPLDEAFVEYRGGVDGLTGLESLGNGAYVHDLVRGPEDVGKAPLGEFSLQGHLAALETGLYVAAAPCCLALAAPSGGLAET